MVHDLHSGNVIAAPFHENHRSENAGAESTNSCDTAQCGNGSPFFLKIQGYRQGWLSVDVKGARHSSRQAEQYESLTKKRSVFSLICC
jgi:hypothetical protein